ncbi:MAG: glutathione S-transferase [Thiobacillus sp.]|nr:glutathione S-transferase [Thiobacillus sp.]
MLQMSHPLPVLYSFRRCPYAIRARLALTLAGIALEVREVTLRDKPAAMLTLSPKGTVPVLQLPDGRVLEQSLDIMHWALGQADAGIWRMDDATGQALIALNDGAFKGLLDGYKYATSQSTHPAEHYRDEAVALFVAPLNQRLSQTPYLLGETATLADLAIVPFIRQFAGVDPGWFLAAPFPALRRWLDAWTHSALFVSIMPRLDPWQPGDPPTLL